MTEGRTALSLEDAVIVARQLVIEYGWLGVNFEKALGEVEKGRWDDHPILKRRR
jgi:hypothetical protein